MSEAAANIQYNERRTTNEEYWTIFLSYLLLFWLFFAQWLIVWWKKKKPSQYFAASLLGLWIIPFSIGVYLENWRFVVSCIVFTLTGVYILRIATKRPLDPGLCLICWF